MSTEPLVCVVHAAETIKGGVATVIEQLSLSTGVAPGSCVLVPACQARELGAVPLEMVCRFERSGRNISSLLSFAWNLAKIVMRVRPEVVHLHSSFAGGVGRAVLVLLRPFVRPRVVYCPHAFSFLMSASDIRRRAMAFIERLLLPLCDAVVCVSQHERSEAIRWGLPAEKLVVVRNGTSAPSDNHPVSPYHNTGLNVLFVGRFDYQKGFDVALEAMTGLRDLPIHLTAVGDFVHDADRLPALENVTCVGWLDREELGSFFHHADCLVLPSRWEGFPMVGLEAMSHGLPIVASRCSSLPELIGDSDCGVLFAPGQAGELAAILRDTTVAEWKEMGRRAQVRFAHEFHVKGTTEALEKLYFRLCASEPLRKTRARANA